VIKTNDSYERRLTKLVERTGFLGSPPAKFLTWTLKKNKKLFTLLVTATLRFGERYELSIFRKLLRKGMVVVDIGANVGLYTFEASRAVGKKGKVIAFEPDPYNFEVLSLRLKNWRFKNVTVVNKALSDTKGQTKLFIDKFSPGGHSFSSENLYSGKSSVEVPTIRLDDFLDEAGIEKVDVIKIDVQGAEGLVFEGAEKTLKNGRASVLMEFWPHGMAQITPKVKEVMQKLEDFGYTFTVLDKKSKNSQKLTSKELFESSSKWSSDTDYTNLLLRKK